MRKCDYVVTGATVYVCMCVCLHYTLSDEGDDDGSATMCPPVIAAKM